MSTSRIDSSALHAKSGPALEVSVSVGASASRALRLEQSGGPLTEPATSAHEIVALVHPEDRSYFEHTLDWATRNLGESARISIRLARGDGNWVSVLAKIGSGNSGRLALNIDLDDAAAARRAEAQIRQIVEGAQQAAVVHVGAKVVYSNPSLARLMGYASLDAMRATGAGADHTHPDDRAMVYSRMKARVSGEGAPDNYEFRALRTDGSMIWLECFASRIAWNGQPAALAWLMDITDRKRTEEALRRSEKLFAAVFQATPAMLTLSRLDDGRFIDVNNSFLRVIGHDREAIVGRTEREIGLFVDRDLPQRIVEAANGASPQRDIVASVRTRTGEVREILISTEMIRFADREMLLTVGRDVTDRRREEEELRQSKATAEFANRAKSEFLASMSHEIRTPLNAILGFSEMIMGEVFGPIGTPRYADYATDIWNSGTHLLQIINDLLDLSKLDAGKLELHETEVSLPRLVEDSIQLLRERAASADVAFCIELSADLPIVRADERLLKQILINLLSNSVKFTPHGGWVSVSGRRIQSGAVELVVSDIGIGMSADEIEIALTPFGQVENAQRRQHEGTGLGLPLARSLAELHGGRLEVRSERGAGTTITVTLPPGRAIVGDQAGEPSASKGNAALNA
jgi:two-component system, cell cycle sensor histidine kinase PleC